MTRPRILVVDDEESMRYFLARSLRREGYEVEAFGSGEEALAASEGVPFELALLDVRLPGLDGLAVLTALRAKSPALPVIVMTGYGTVERALEAMRKGATDFVPKPLKLDELLGKISEALGRKPATPEPVVPAPAVPRSTAPRPLTAFLLEAAKERALPVPGEGGGDLSLRTAERLFTTLYFSELLERTGGNVSVAARIAGISRPNLHRRIRELDLDVRGFRA